MKKIFLHIGCGKTGSSALQLWLNNNAKELNSGGVYYPLFGSGKLDEYVITSGNGIHFMDSISKSNVRELLVNVIKEAGGRDILFSSEQFQSLGETDLQQLKDLFTDLDLDPVVIAYVRDVYDIIYSSYLQLVKRHLYTQTFREFALARRDAQQFKVVRRWSSVFNTMKVMHYDSEKESLDISFCSALGVARGRIPAMPKMKVNRSLTLEETELLRLINHEYVTQFDDPNQYLSWVISDAFIMNEPEALTPILVDQNVLKHVENIFKSDIDWVNDKFFMGEEVLSTFNPDGKFIATEMPTLSKPIATAIHALMSAITSFDLNGHILEARKKGQREKLKISDPRIVEALRDEAIRREQDSLMDALALMSAAKTLRPSGPQITSKVNEYRAKLDPKVGS